MIQSVMLRECPITTAWHYLWSVEVVNAVDVMKHLSQVLGALS